MFLLRKVSLIYKQFFLYSFNKSRATYSQNGLSLKNVSIGGVSQCFYSPILTVSLVSYTLWLEDIYLNTYTDELVRMDNPKMVIAVDAVQLDVKPADNDNKTFLVPLPQVPTEKEKRFTVSEGFCSVTFHLHVMYSEQQFEFFHDSFKAYLKVRNKLDGIYATHSSSNATQQSKIYCKSQHFHLVISTT